MANADIPEETYLDISKRIIRKKQLWKTIDHAAAEKYNITLMTIPRIRRQSITGHDRPEF